VKVPDGKGPANRTVPESCPRSGREAHREALAGVRVGQPLSREITLSGVPTLRFDSLTDRLANMQHFRRSGPCPTRDESGLNQRGIVGEYRSTFPSRAAREFIYGGVPSNRLTPGPTGRLELGKPCALLRRTSL
jgi:hypothetical protein